MVEEGSEGAPGRVVAQELYHPGEEEEAEEEPAEEEDPPGGGVNPESWGSEKKGKETHLKEEVVPLEAHPEPTAKNEGEVEEVLEKEEKGMEEPQEEKNRNKGTARAQEMDHRSRGGEPEEGRVLPEPYPSTAQVGEVFLQGEDPPLPDQPRELHPEGEEGSEVDEAEPPEEKGKGVRVRRGGGILPGKEVGEPREQGAVRCHEAVKGFAQEGSELPAGVQPEEAPHDHGNGGKELEDRPCPSVGSPILEQVRLPFAKLFLEPQGAKGELLIGSEPYPFSASPCSPSLYPVAAEPTGTIVEEEGEFRDQGELRMPNRKWKSRDPCPRIKHTPPTGMRGERGWCPHIAFAYMLQQKNKIPKMYNPEA